MIQFSVYNLFSAILNNGVSYKMNDASKNTHMSTCKLKWVGCPAETLSTKLNLQAMMKYNLSTQSNNMQKPILVKGYVLAILVLGFASQTSNSLHQSNDKFQKCDVQKILRK